MTPIIWSALQLWDGVAIGQLAEQWRVQVCPPSRDMIIA